MADKKTDAIVKQEAPGALARPERLKSGGHAGTEHITKDDIQMPRLALAQGMTPQVLESVEGFSVGSLFNNITNEVYGKGPLDFAIVRADRPRGIQFRPQEEGGGIIDMNVPLNDPRMLFGADGEKPVATKFYDFYIAMLPLKEDDPLGSLICLSMKSTALKVAKQLNTFIKLRNADLWEGKYTLTTGVDKNDKGTFAVYKVKNVGWVSDEESAVLKMIFESLADKNIVVEREPGDDSFVPEEIEREGGAAAEM